MNKDNKLTQDDIKKLINVENNVIIFPSIKLFGININLDYLKLSILSIIIWIIIWYFFGLFKLNKYSIIFFILLIIFNIFNIFNTPINIEKNFEVTTFINQGQIQRCLFILGVILLTFIFLSKIKIDNEYIYNIYKIYIIIIILLFFSLFKYELKNTSKNFTTISENMYNQSLILLVYTFYLIFIGISNKK